MNARQKAKHFKRLYEESLPKKPYPVVYKSILPKHYRILQLIDVRDAVYAQDNSNWVSIMMIVMMKRRIRMMLDDIVYVLFRILFIMAMIFGIIALIGVCVFIVYCIHYLTKEVSSCLPLYVWMC